MPSTEQSGQSVQNAWRCGGRGGGGFGKPKFVKKVPREAAVAAATVNAPAVPLDLPEDKGVQ